MTQRRVCMTLGARNVTEHSILIVDDDQQLLLAQDGSQVTYACRSRPSRRGRQISLT